jgi:hypothetical protein
MSVVHNCYWPSPVQSSSGSTPVRLVTTFYCLKFETPPTWRSRSPYVYPQGTGWPSYNPRHWGPFSLPPTTRRFTVEVFCPRPHRNFSGGYEKFYLLGYNAVWSCKSQPTSRRNMSSLPSGCKSTPSKTQPAEGSKQRPVCVTLGQRTRKRHVPLKRRFIIIGLHGVISQKTELSIRIC